MTFCQIGGKLAVETAFHLAWKSVLSSFSAVIIERTCESAKFLISLSILLRNNQHRSIISPFLLGVSLSLQDRALGGAYTFAHGKRPAFFSYSDIVILDPVSKTDVASCARSLIPRGRPVYPPVRSASHYPSIAGLSIIRQVYCILLFRTCRTLLRYSMQICSCYSFAVQCSCLNEHLNIRISKSV